MRVALLAVGHRMPAWVRDSFDEYAKRLRARLPVTLVEIPAGRRTGADSARAVAEEGKRLLAKLKPSDHVVLLDERGTARSSLDHSRWLGARLRAGRDLAFLVGGPDGFSADVIARADERWSLSSLTLPHALVRIVWIEQMYRGVTLLDGHPYHRE